MEISILFRLIEFGAGRNGIEKVNLRILPNGSIQIRDEKGGKIPRQIVEDIERRAGLKLV